MTITRIILLLISICLSDGLIYLGGNINWQPSLQKNKPDWIMISVNVNWLANSNEKVFCHQSAKEPYMDIIGYIYLFNTYSLKDFTQLRCNIVEMDKHIILSVRYQRLYKIKPSTLDIRMFGILDPTDASQKSWALQLQGSSGSGGARPPIVTAPPLVVLCYGSQKPLTHYVQAINLDSSLVQKCRWSTSLSECGNICASNEQKKVFQLEEDCSLTYRPKTLFSTTALVREPQVLAITVESFKSGSLLTNPVSSTNLQFSVMEVPDKCQEYGLKFSKTIKQVEFFQKRCSPGFTQIPFDVTSTDPNATGLGDIKMVNGPTSSTLTQHSSNLLSSPKRVTYVFEWKPTETDDGTHPICFAVTHDGQTKYECSTITSYGSNSTISQPACTRRINCVADVFSFCAAPDNVQSTTKSAATAVRPWMIGLPLGLLALLAIIAVLIALLIRQKKKKGSGQVEEMEADDYIEPDDDFVFNHRPVQLRKFSTISEIMPNAIPITKPGYTPNRYALKLFPDHLKVNIHMAGHLPDSEIDTS